MNSNCNSNRFSKVLVHDFHNTYSLFGLSMLITLLIPAFIWILGLALQDAVVEVWNRRNFIKLAVYLTAAISSMKIYNSCNLVGKGNYFAMLPASLCEKFSSMLIYCLVICPLVVFVGSVAVDTLLTLLPFGPYKEYLWQLPDWMRKINTIGGYTSFGGLVLTAMKIFAVASLFMLANTIFKKNKFIKTVLWLLVIAFALILIIAPIMNHINWADNWDWIVKIGEWLKIKSQEQLLRLFYWSQFVFFALLTFIFSFITYRRLKKMQY